MHVYISCSSLDSGTLAGKSFALSLISGNDWLLYRYSRKMWEELKAEGRPVWEVGKIIGQKWREMTDTEKQPFFDEYEAEKIVYAEQMKMYKSSPAYKRWMEAKQQG